MFTHKDDMMGLKNIMKISCLKFGPKEIASKDFQKQKQLTDIFMINVNKIVVYNIIKCHLVIEKIGGIL